MALPQHADRDLVASILAMAGLPQADIERALSRSGSPQVVWDTVMGRDYPKDVRNRLELAGKYMETLSGGDLRTLLVDGHKLPASVVDRAIQGASSGDTIASVLERIANDKSQYVNRTHARQTIAGILGTSQTIGSQGLNRSKQDYMQQPGAPTPTGGGVGNRAPLAPQGGTTGLVAGMVGGTGAVVGAARPGGRSLADTVKATSALFQPGAAGEIPTEVPRDRAGVMNLQRLLNARGANLAVDGVYGPKTQAAHRQYGAGTVTAPGPGATGETLGSLFPGAGTPTNVNAPVTTPSRIETEWAKVNPADDAAVEAFIRREFGFAAWALEIPEVRQTLVEFTRDMAGQPFSEGQLEARLLGTQWWREKTDVQRERIKERNEQPATYNANVLGQVDNLRALVNQAGTGFSVSDERLQEIARTAYEQGWTIGEQRAAIAAEFDYDPATGTQAASAIVGTLNELAAQYLVPLSEATIDQWGRQMISGTATQETITGYLREQAKQLLPSFAQQIEAGLTPTTLVEPYRQVIAKEMGSDPTQVDFLDAKWNRFVNSPSKDGPRPMSYWEIQQTLRTDESYGWDKTKNARMEATEFATQLAQRFGRAG